MFFDSLFNFLIYYLAFLMFFALLGLVFSKKSRQSKAKIYKICPCKKAVENGLMSSICMYSAALCFMLALTNIALIANYHANNFIVLALSLVCGVLGWWLKK